MSFYHYNADRDNLVETYYKTEENINGKIIHDDKFKSYEAIKIETENILKREHTIFIITSTLTAILVAYTLQQL